MNEESGRVPAWRRYLRFFGRNPDADVDDELRTHLELRIEDNLARGLDTVEARREALQRFGDLERVRAECRIIGHQRERSMRRTRFLGDLRQDLRYAARTLARSPGFAAVAIISLALGIGANVAVFGLVDSVVLRPLPRIARPAELVELGTTMSYPAFRFVRDETDIFAGVAAHRTRNMSVNTGESARVESVGIVSGNYFDVLGTPPALGRAFLPEEERPGARIPVTVLGHGFWTSAFGGDRGVVGRTIRLNGAAFTVIGVAPRLFRGTQALGAPALWIPIEAWPLTAVGELAQLDIARPTWGWLRATGRLRPDVPLAEAQERLRALGTRQRAASTSLGAEFADATVRPARSVAATLGTSGPGIDDLALLLLGVVGLTLLIACTNVAGLLVARSSRRHREIGIRLAIGAGRGRLVRQLLTESLMLGLVGAVVGVGIAAIGSSLISTIGIPGEGPIELTGGDVTPRMLGVAALLGVGSAVLFGLVPALQATRTRLVPTMVETGATPHGRARLRAGLIVAQLALSLVLLAGAGLFLRSVGAALDVETGYDVGHIAIAFVNPGLQGFDPERADRFYRDLAERLERQPEVVAVSWAATLPLTASEDALDFRLPAVEADTTQRVIASFNAVGPSWFRASGLPLVRGRDIGPQDDARSSPVAVINETMARRHWPDGDALGARLGFRGSELTIVGVARDALYTELTDESAPHVYLPASQIPNRLIDHTAIVVRTAGDPARMIPTIRTQMRALEPEVAVLDVLPYASVVAQLVSPQRMAATFLGLFGVLTLVLAAVGVYGIMAYLVVQRTRELGIRLALGATRADVLRLVLGRSAVLIGMGVAIGIALALAGSRAIAGFLFGVGAADPVAFAGGALVLGSAALAASVIPAHRAASIAPTEALRSD